MHSRKPFSSVLRTLLAFALLALPVAAQGKGQVPFKGQYAGSGSTVAGHATHLGHFTGTVSVTPTPTGFSGGYIWQAANGDLLMGTLDVTIGPELSPGIFAFDSTSTLIGGTGHFEGATGSSGGPGVFDFSTFSFEGQFKGTISSVGSNK